MKDSIQFNSIHVTHLFLVLNDLSFPNGMASSWQLGIQIFTLKNWCYNSSLGCRWTLLCEKLATSKQRGTCKVRLCEQQKNKNQSGTSRRFTKKITRNITEHNLANSRRTCGPRFRRFRRTWGSVSCDTVTPSRVVNATCRNAWPKSNRAKKKTENFWSFRFKSLCLSLEFDAQESKRSQ